MGEGRQRLLEEAHRLAVGPARGGLGAGLPQIGHRLVPHLAAQRVVGQGLHLIARAVGVQLLQRFHHPRVQRPAALPEEGIVGDLLGQRVAERVLHARKEAELVEEISGLEDGEVAPDLVLRHVGDGLEQYQRHILADDGGRLQQALRLRRQAIDAWGQDGVDRGRELDALDGLDQPIRAPLARQRLGLHERADALLDEEGVALRPADQPALERLEGGVAAEQRIQ